MFRLAIAGEFGRYLGAYDLERRLLGRDQQHSPFASTEVYEGIFARVYADPVDHPRRRSQRRREIADSKLSRFGTADAEIIRLDGAGGVRAMPGIEFRVEFRCVAPVREFGRGCPPTETLEAIANTAQPARPRRRSPPCVVQCRLHRTVQRVAFAVVDPSSKAGSQGKYCSL